MCQYWGEFKDQTNLSPKVDAVRANEFPKQRKQEQRGVVGKEKEQVADEKLKGLSTALKPANW